LPKFNINEKRHAVKASGQLVSIINLRTCMVSKYDQVKRGTLLDKGKMNERPVSRKFANTLRKLELECAEHDFVSRVGVAIQTTA